MRLTRELRLFSANAHQPPTNSWAGSATSGDVGAFWKLRATVQGPVDRHTGYVCNIQSIDQFLRKFIAPSLLKHIEGKGYSLEALGVALSDALKNATPTIDAESVLVSLELHLSPYTRLRVERETSNMISLTHSFEFSAAHRLYCKDFTDAENARHFGKCANPNGHGHNYVLEVSVSGQPDARTGLLADLPALDRTVKEIVIDRFDHKHLNLDCSEFASLNPSVENIARVIWKLLHSALAPAKLSSIRVWETPKTCAEYCGDE